MKQKLLILFSFACLATNAQTVDEIIHQYANAMGGLDNINKVQTLKKTGTLIAQGLELQMTVQVINNKAIRTEIEAMGKKLIVCYKDEKAWTLNPFAGDTTATDVTGPELLELKAQCQLSSHLMDYKARGHQVELIGKDTVDSATAYKIKLVNKESGIVTYYLIDSTTSLLVRLFTITEDNVGDEIKMATTFSDLRTFGELKFNMIQTQTVNGEILREIKFNIVELNVPIDEKIFEKQ